MQYLYSDDSGLYYGELFFIILVCIGGTCDCVVKVLNSAARGAEFNPWLGQCVVSLNKMLYLHQLIWLLMSSSVPGAVADHGLACCSL